MAICTTCSPANHAATASAATHRISNSTTTGAEMDDCGRSEPGRFEPRAGKGAVARATLYFLLRYPGMIGDESRELQAERLPILLAWHEAEPVGEWERHRNAAIVEIQGNRNPLIDNPQWASRIPFQTAFGRPGG